MKSNGLLKWLMIPVLALVAYLCVKMFSSAGDLSTSAAKAQHENRLTEAEAKKLGVEGDTAHDTVATLVAQVKQLRHELDAATQDNKTQRALNDRLQARDSSMEQRIKASISAERERWQRDQDKATSEEQQTQGVVQELQRRLDGLSRTPGHNELPVGLGLENVDTDAAGDAVRWHEPQDTRPDQTKQTKEKRSRSPPDARKSGTGQFSTSFGLAPSEESSDRSAEDNDVHSSPVSLKAQLAAADPVYTVPADSTLVGSIAMTALIGRVPVDGAVNDPYPFKVLIGPDNLTANGIDLPDVAGAVASGTASGDWTLSCVRGQIRSLTFVFKDKTIRTVTSSESHDRRGANSLESGLGWISDAYGIPCVSGVRRSNAQQYLSSQMLITAAGAGAASLIDQGRGGNFSFAGGSNGVLGTVGITGNEAVGRILGNGVQEMAQWVDKLYGQAFAAVYVKPGAHVAIHIDEPLEIDYDPNGRKVAHRWGGEHASDLD